MHYKHWYPQARLQRGNVKMKQGKLQEAFTDYSEIVRNSFFEELSKFNELPMRQFVI